MATKKKPSKKLKKTSQKQKQAQSQKIVINLASHKRRKPKATAAPQTARVLSQFIQPSQMIPDYRTMINPVSVPMPFNTPTQSPNINNAFAPRPSAVTEGRILGSAPIDAPLYADINKPLSSNDKDDDTSTQGRTLLPQQPLLTRGWSGGAVSDAGISSLSDTDVDLNRTTTLRRRGSDTTRGLFSVDETTVPDDDMKYWGSGGGGIPSPSLTKK